ncbi:MULTISPECIES: hypothetical protein [Romboutsia]|uniref:Uncharacterized protein n=1 Tax=Romboutsia hominis TaxID=1507512 RepID=A0A2P2BT29_9FIRM|nr:MULTISPECIES: hypothetical protein [Romboutsia]MCH1960791.1 hypothetical protein [Romboutsia hominis]MCH1968775.1 hypothetical protein [Romboutsia hominis]MDB8789881.1 hypothetical protein [Romboutsia sp. 1001216sp1]MDB8793705.1 hypothetical protein [Romboutsia sp. 1001216sp1]MDB8795102.1 hypothetical protein [Romboutsia sp. 1001216sp1]
MLKQLSKNQYVKMTKVNDKEKEVEYGVVLNKNEDNYEIMTIGFINKNGNFLEYPIESYNLVDTYNIDDAYFDEVKENEVRRKMNIWMEEHYRH